MGRHKGVKGTRLEQRRTFLARAAVVGGSGVLGSGAIAGVAQGTPGMTLAGNGDMRRVRLDTATVDDFIPAIGERFSVQPDSGVAFRATLVEANRVRRGLRFRRDQFSIVFDVDGRTGLEQERYHIDHPRLGSLDLFMVPVDLPADRTRLEAVFT